MGRKGNDLQGTTGKVVRKEDGMNPLEINAIGRKLAHVVTEHDRKQSTKRGYNVHALGIMLDAVHNIERELAIGYALRSCILNNVCGRLANQMLHAVGEPKQDDSELRSGRYVREER
jgi:hypothetical protein